VFLFLSEFQTCLSNGEVGNEDEEEGSEKRYIEADDFQENPASDLTDFRNGAFI
jgi:hypothetical protein